MSDIAVIRIYRPHRTRLQTMAERDSNPEYGVRVDGAEAGSIRPEEVLTLDVSPGPHTLEVHYRPPYRLSRKRNVTVTSGQVLDMVLTPGWLSALSGLIWLRGARSGDRERMERFLNGGA